MKRRKFWLLSASLLLLTAAFGLISYPILSNYLSDRNRSEVRTEYYSRIEKMDDRTLWDAEKEAVKYNGLLSSGISDNSKGLVNTDYDTLLNINNDGIMGYVEIPAINVYLPIAHGTDAKTLENYVGHVVGSSLPVGGKGTHTVLSGHSGLAGQVMFNDLSQLKKGDTAYIHVLGKVLAYKVDSSSTVLPSDVSLLSIEPDSDELTLITSTPVGVNTHRLLVHCSRTEYVPGEELSPETMTEPEQMQSDWIKQYVRGVCLGAAVLALAALICCVREISRKNRGKRDVQNN